jgi:uncharacterized protein
MSIVSDDVLSRLRAAAPSAIASRPVRFAYLFGSQATGTARPDSDVDVAISLDPKVEPERRLDLTLAISRELATASGLSGIEVVVLEDVPLPLRGRIASEGVVIYGVDEPARVEFESRTFREYGDVEIAFRGLHRELLEHIAAGRR